jgi:hypothetical protein
MEMFVQMEQAITGHSCLCTLQAEEKKINKVKSTGKDVIGVD